MVKEEQLTRDDVDLKYRGKNSRFENLTGQVFGKLTVLGMYRKEGNTLKWVVECTCGNIVKTSRSRLKGRGKSSCVECAEKALKGKILTPMEDKIIAMEDKRKDLHTLKPLGEAWSDNWEVTCTSCNDTYQRRYRDLLRGVKACSCKNLARKGLEEKKPIVDKYCKENNYTFKGWTKHKGHIAVNFSCNSHGGDYTSMFENLKKGKIPCKVCRKDKYTPYNLKSQDKFIEESIAVHGDLYDYTFSEYKRSMDKVKIFCNRCGKFFQQAPAMHIKGKGCADCADYGIKPSKPCWIYIMKLEGLCEEWYKVGITRDLKSRLYNVSLKSWYDITYIDFKKFTTGKDALRVESQIVGQLKTTNLINPKYHKDGRTEIFKLEELSVVENLLEEHYLEYSLQKLQDNN